MAKYTFTYEKARKYLKDLLSDKDRYTIEREAAKNPFEEEALEGLSSLTGEEFVTDVKKFENQINSRVTRKKRIVFLPQFQIAAGLLLVVGIGFFIFLKSSEESVNPIVNTEDSIEKDAINTPIVYTEKTTIPDKNNKPEGLFDREKVGETLDSIQEKRTEESVVFEKTLENEKPKFAPTSVPEKSIIESTGKRASAIENSNSTHKKEKKSISKVSGIVEIEFNEEELEIKENLVPTKTITGVVSSNGLPMPGVNVKVKGGTAGAVTDFDGNYIIDARVGDTLQFLSTGFVTENRVVSNANKSVNILLKEDVEVLEDVVVIGYGKSKKKDLVGAVVSVKAEEIEKSQVGTLEQALERKVAGVNVVTQKGRDIVLQKATFKKGSKEVFKQWIYQKLNREVLEEGKSYKITVSFAVSKKGKIKDVVIKNDIPLNLKKEIEETLLSSPKWKPAVEEGEKIEEEITLELRISEGK